MDRLALEPLNKREQEILDLLEQGFSDREIAHKLTLAVSTVKWYNRQIYDKLGVNSRTQAAARARQAQLLDGDFSVTTPHNLPAQTTHLIGRQHEVAAVQRQLRTVRLLTLTGPPGTGKTRLALQVAEEIAPQFADGVCFVPLAPLTDASRIANAIAGALAVQEVVTEPLIDTLKHHLHPKQLLLVLDNVEHLLAGVAVVSELLASAPQIKILTTSRALMNLYGENEYSVPPLALPAVTDAESVIALDCEAVALFVQRAQAVKPGFELTQQNALDIAKICVRLDGLPLTIELAAARTKLLAPGALLERLSSRLDMLVGGARDLPARQQTLRNTIDWSYDLLSNGEKMLFARLAIFSGGWSMAAAEQVCSTDSTLPVLDGLSALIDQGLVQRQDTPEGEPRFTMLETLREYALERLEASGEADTIRSRHADYFIGFVELTGRALDTINRAAGMSRLEIEQNNIRAVLGWSLAGDPEPGLRMIAAVGICWRIRSYMIEGFQWAQQLLERGRAVDPALRSRALSSTGTLLACHLGNFAEAARMSQEALELALNSGDEPTLAAAWYARSAALIETDPALAHPAIDNALRYAQKSNDRWARARAMNLKGELLRLEGDYDGANDHYVEALVLFRELGNPWGINVVLNNLAAVTQIQHHVDKAQSLYTEALRLSAELRDQAAIAAGLAGMAGVLGDLQQPERAAQLFGAAQTARDVIGAHIQASDRAGYKRNVAQARAQLSADAFESAWAAGQKMSIEQALTLALDDNQDEG